MWLRPRQARDQSSSRGTNAGTYPVAPSSAPGLARSLHAANRVSRLRGDEVNQIRLVIIHELSAGGWILEPDPSTERAETELAKNVGGVSCTKSGGLIRVRDRKSREPVWRGELLQAMADETTREVSKLHVWIRQISPMIWSRVLDPTGNIQAQHLLYPVWSSTLITRVPLIRR